MKKFRITLASIAFAAASMTTAAFAGDKDVVQTFYNYLSNPSSASHAETFKGSTVEGWESIGDYSGKIKTRDQFIGQLGGFGQLIPDMKWAVEEMLQDGNRVIVRSRATGTPNGPMFGVDGKGKSFDIMTIDIHTLEDDKIVRTYHVEDWAGALQQLGAK